MTGIEKEIGKIGTNSFYVLLPKQWARFNDLKKGSKIRLVDKGNVLEIEVIK